MLISPSSNSRKGPLLELVKRSISDADKTLKLRCLEISSGTGECVVHLAKHLPEVDFQPSDLNPRYIHSMVAYIDQEKLPNLRIPLMLDVSKTPDFWPLPQDFGPGQVDIFLNINSPAQAAIGMFRAASGLLRRGSGKLLMLAPSDVLKAQQIDFGSWPCNIATSPMRAKGVPLPGTLDYLVKVVAE